MSPLTGTETDSTLSSAPPGKHTIRWWPAVVVLAGAAVALGYIWVFRDAQRQNKNLATFGLVAITVGLLLLWVLLLSRLGWKYRFLIVGGVLGAWGVLAASLEITGVTGDLIPIFQWRWQTRPAVAEFGTPNASHPSSADAATIPPPGDYPQFGGPSRDGKRDGPRLSRNWEVNPPEELWRRQVGAGWSGFATSGYFAVTMEQRREEEHITCYHLLTGDQLWSYAYDAHFQSTVAGEGPRTVPTIHGQRVYAIGSTGVVSCIELATGRCVWSKNILEEHGTSVPEWGFSASPLVVDNKLVVNPGGRNEASLVAYDAADGTQIWGGGRDRPPYSSPVLTSLDGVDQVLLFNQKRLVSHSLDDGRILWDHEWVAPGHPNVAAPIVLSENRILASAGYGEGSLLLRVQHESDDSWSTEVVWHSKGLKSKFANIIVIDDFIYGLDDGIFVCLDLATGDRMWKRGRYGHGQMILVGDVLLVMSEKGYVVLLEPNPEQHRELARFAAFNTKTWNPPALAGEYLLVRNDKEAACYRLPIVNN